MGSKKQITQKISDAVLHACRIDKINDGRHHFGVDFHKRLHTVWLSWIRWSHIKEQLNEYTLHIGRSINTYNFSTLSSPLKFDLLDFSFLRFNS